MSLKLPLLPTIISLDVYGDHGHSEFGGRSTSPLVNFGVLLDELTELVASGRTDHPLGVQRGLRLQRVLHQARLLAQA
jgi:hypothetical protein